ncbi:MAG TPA: hypothetical protein DCQ99_08735 [Nitrospinae bacterium]|nr:hypothetical protein [Nitrospinota bacterium]
MRNLRFTIYDLRFTGYERITIYDFKNLNLKSKIVNLKYFYCLLLTAYCLLPSAYCLLFTVFCLLSHMLRKRALKRRMPLSRLHPAGWRLRTGKMLYPLWRMWLQKKGI